MKTRLIAYALSALIRALPPDKVKALIDDIIDVVEDKLDGNPVAMKTIGWLREIIGIDDGIDGDEN